jgi:hypothetical protein
MNRLAFFVVSEAHFLGAGHRLRVGKTENGAAAVVLDRPDALLV